MVNLRLRVTGPREITVSGPLHSSFNRLWSFYVEHRHAAERGLREAEQSVLLPATLGSDACLPLLGTCLALRRRMGGSNRMQAESNGLVWHAKDHTREQAERAYAALLRDTLYDYASAALGNLAPGATLIVKPYKAKWGLCRPERNEISLNLTLAALSPKYIDYVLAHEVAHLAVPDHSASFYRRLEALEPRWRELRAGLRRYGRLRIG